MQDAENAAKDLWSAFSMKDEKIFKSYATSGKSTA